MAVIRSILVILIAFPLAARTFSGAKVHLHAPHNPDAIAVADFNGDGRDDVAATDQFCAFRPCALMIFYQQAGGGYGEPVLYPGFDRASAIQAAHFNGDDRIDVAVASTSGVHVYLQQPDGAFDQTVTYQVSGTYDLAAGDVNRDGRTDLVSMRWGGSQLAVFEQQPGGGFVQKAAPIGGYGYDDFDLVDLDGDGMLDAVNVSGQGQRGVLHLNYGTATGFGNVIRMQLPWIEIFDAVEAGDFNGDGRIDLAMTSYGQGDGPFLALLLQTANRTFTAGPTLPVYRWPNTLLARDLDEDGDVDLAVGGGSKTVYSSVRQVIEVWIQTRPGVFVPEDYVLPGISSNFSTHDHLAIGDANDDGRADLIVGIDNGALIVFEGREQGRGRTVRH